MSGSFLIVFGLVWMSLIVVFALLPDFSRELFRFGVSLPAEGRQHPAVHHVRKQYRVVVIALGLLLAGVSMGLGAGTELPIHLVNLLVAGPLCLYLLVVIGSYVRGNRAVLALKNEHGWTVPVQRIVMADTTKPHVRFSSKWHLIPLLLSVLQVVIVALLYPRLPDTIVLHMNAAGVADRIGEKTIGTVFGINIIQFLIVLLMWGTGIIVSMKRERLDPDDTAGSAARTLHVQRATAAYLLSMSILIVLTFVIIQWGSFGFLSASLMITGLLVLFVLLMISSISFGLRMRKRSGNETTLHPNDQDRYWTFGEIYYNPNDPSLLVSKRVGIGWTVNLGHPVGKLLASIPFVILIVVLVWGVGR